MKSAKVEALISTQKFMNNLLIAQDLTFVKQAQPQSSVLADIDGNVSNFIAKANYDLEITNFIKNDFQSKHFYQNLWTFNPNYQGLFDQENEDFILTEFGEMIQKSLQFAYDLEQRLDNIQVVEIINLTIPENA